MSTGQTRVVVLLIVLFFMEMLLQPGIQQFWHGIKANLNTSLGGK